MSLDFAAGFILACFMARLLRAERAQAWILPAPPSGSDVAVASSIAAIRKAERFAPPQWGFTVIGWRTIDVQGERFVVKVERADG